MRSFTVGQTISVPVTVSGAGSIDAETFTARAESQSGHPMTATAAVTNAATRLVTVTVAADQWREPAGGYGRIELAMTAAGVVTLELAEEFRVRPGLQPQDSRGLDAYGWT